MLLDRYRKTNSSVRLKESQMLLDFNSDILPGNVRQVAFSKALAGIIVLD